MANETLGLKNVNMLSKEQYNGIAEPVKDELYAISGSGFGFPSDRFIDLELGASGSSYTAPANGWVLVGKRCTANQFLGTYDNSIMHRMEVWDSNYCSLFFPVRKGDIFPISYTASGVTEVFRFVYAEGEE